MYQSVSTAEKRQQLQEANIPWPVCDCCGMEKQWDPRRNKFGGNWSLKCKRIKRQRKLRRTPGTWEYNWSHGIGVQGEKRRRSEYKKLRTPGNYLYDRNLARIDERAQKYIPGTEEYEEYYRRKLYGR